jgi:fructuronate reductase
VTRLTRDALGGTAPAPVRIVHLGLGAFHRAHQAWYTARAADAAEWGIAAFTGRDPGAADELAPQGGVYSLVERSDSGDALTIVTSIVEAVDGADVERLVALLALPSTAIVTLTVTEAGYRLTPDGAPDLSDPAVVADLAGFPSAPPQTVLGRLLLGLAARRSAGAGPIAIVPCDNMPDNGTVVGGALLRLAASVDDQLGAWIGENVSFVSTSVDRITPKTTPDDLATVARLGGWDDRAAVVTEPFSDWVLSGEFPAGRPDWASAGARFVDDIAPFESRKLWLLNGAHSLLAYTARQHGHETVAAAIADDRCLADVEEFWDAAERHLPDGVDLELPRYRAALLDRFRNARIEHRLAQIANDGSTKLRIRVVPIVLAERAAGRDGVAGLRAIAGWISQLSRGGVLAASDLTDPLAPSLRAAALLPTHEAVPALLTLVDPALGADDELVAEVLALVIASTTD